MIDFKPEEPIDFQLDFQPDEELPPSGKQASALDYLKGLGEETLALGTSMAVTPFAGLAGLSASLMGGLEKGVEVREAVQKAGTYQPRTAKGQELTEAAGRILELPGQYGEKAGGAIGRAVGGELGERTGEFLGRVGGEFATDLIPVAGIVKGARAVQQRIAAPPAPAKTITTGPDVRGAAAALEAKAAQKAPTEAPGAQLELPFERVEGGVATPYDAGMAGVTEPISPKLQRRQMELPMGEGELIEPGGPIIERGPAGTTVRYGPGGEPLTERLPGTLSVDPQGQVFRGDVSSPEARIALEGQAKAFATEIEKGNVPDRVAAGEPLPQLQDPSFLDALRRQYLQEPQKITTDIFETLEAERARLKQEQMDALFEANAQTPERSAEAVERARKAEETETQLMQLEEDLRTAIPGVGAKGRIKKQGGGILFDFGKKKEVEKILGNKAISSALPELSLDARTPEEVVALARSVPDVDPRNLMQRGVAQFTKGFLFEKFKTDHPIIKYAYDKTSDAVDAARFIVSTLIDKQLSPSLRKLSNKELAELGDILMVAMKNKQELTPDFLRQHGFSEKQIAAQQLLKDIHEQSFARLNESRRLAGKKPLEPYIGYVTGLASGNFRKVIYTNDADGKPTPVGIVGSDFRHVLDRRVKELLANNPEYYTSAEKYTGTKKQNRASTKALEEALAILSDNDPNFTTFAKKMDDVITGETYKSLGAAKHTMGKKGVFGMEGAKPWQSSYENAKDLFNAQIRYTETMAKWSEFSKAMDDLAKVFSDPEVQQKHPLALEMAQDYVKNAMGQNPTQVGQAIDNLIGAVGDELGVGPAVVRKTLQLGRNTVNTLFFTLNHAWMAVNIAQPFLVMPETKAFLRGRGIDVNLELTGASDLLLKGSYSSLKHLAGWKETPFEQAMWKYAKEHGIDQTRLIESHSAIRNDPKYWLSQTLRFGANAVEASPRSVMFSTLAHLLEQSGYGKDPNLFPVARQLTDMAMSDYRRHEQIRASQQLGSLGEMSANLTSFKHNTLSRYALFAREMGKGNAGAFSTALVAALAYAGVMGLPGFTEADALVEWLSRRIGKPTSLTKITLDTANKVNTEQDGLGDMLAMGMGAYYGVDLHNRVGMPSMAPSLTGGFGKFAQIGEAAVEAATVPGEWSAKQLARQVAPPPLQPWMDMTWFTQTTEEGQQIALNKQGKGTVVRTEKDILFKKLGFTGVAESKAKALDYAKTQQDKYYQDKQIKVMTQLQGAVAANKGNVPESVLQALVKDYVDAQGDPANLEKAMERAQININTSAKVRRILKETSGSLGGAYKLQREDLQ